MSKRFRDTAIWQKPWFRKLKPAEKLAWDYILDNCDNVGVWVPDFEAAEFFIGEKIDWELFANSTNGNLEQLPNSKWWVVDFCRFQHGDLLTRKESPAVRSYLALLETHGLKDRVAQQFTNCSPTVDEQLSNSCPTVKGKGKGKGKGTGTGKGEGTGKGNEPEPEDFTAFWDEYPHKVNRAGALRAWRARVREKSLTPDEIMLALRNYQQQVAGKDLQYVMHPSTFLGPEKRWRDYLATTPKAAAPYVRRVVHKFCKSCGKEYWGSACDCGWSE